MIESDFAYRPDFEDDPYRPPRPQRGQWIAVGLLVLLLLGGGVWWSRRRGSTDSGCTQVALDIQRQLQEAGDLSGRLRMYDDRAQVMADQFAAIEEISPLLSKYWGWGNGDIRKERARLFRKLLAASFACKKLFPLTPGLEESYIELRHLAKLFGIQENV